MKLALDNDQFQGFFDLVAAAGDEQADGFAEVVYPASPAGLIFVALRDLVEVRAGGDGGAIGGGLLLAASLALHEIEQNRCRFSPCARQGATRYSSLQNSQITSGQVEAGYGFGRARPAVSFCFVFGMW